MPDKNDCFVPIDLFEPFDLLDDDRDQNNPNEMSAEDWDNYYSKLGPDFDEYLDHDHTMDI
jgi:hypothetical protein